MSEIKYKLFVIQIVSFLQCFFKESEKIIIKMIITVILRKKRQVTIPRHICNNLEVDEKDLLTIDIQKVIRKDEEKVADE